MPTVPQHMMPTPSTVETLDLSVLLVSEISRMPRHHRPDAQVQPRQWRFMWRNPSGVVGDHVRRHYDEFPQHVFQVKLPRTGEVVFAKWLGAPSITWASSTTVATIVAEVEEALAHE